MSTNCGLEDLQVVMENTCCCVAGFDLLQTCCPGQLLPTDDGAVGLWQCELSAPQVNTRGNRQRHLCTSEQNSPVILTGVPSLRHVRPHKMQRCIFRRNKVAFWAQPGVPKAAAPLTGEPESQLYSGCITEPGPEGILHDFLAPLSQRVGWSIQDPEVSVSRLHSWIPQHIWSLRPPRPAQDLFTRGHSSEPDPCTGHNGLSVWGLF